MSRAGAFQYRWTVFLLVAMCWWVLPAGAKNCRVQCPKNTRWPPATTSTNPYAAWPNSSKSGEPAYTGPKSYTPSLNFTNQVPLTYVLNGGAVKCQQISGGAGYMTEADGNQTFMFAFGPLSGLDKIQRGRAGTDYSDEFDQPYCNASGVYNNGQPIPYAAGQPDPLAPNSTLPSCGVN